MPQGSSQSYLPVFFDQATGTSYIALPSNATYYPVGSSSGGSTTIGSINHYTNINHDQRSFFGTQIPLSLI
jgi:hypothetical protein